MAEHHIPEIALYLTHQRQGNKDGGGDFRLNYHSRESPGVIIMDSNTLVLDATQLSLRLATNETGWCRLSVAKDGATHLLGADSLRVIKRRLAAGLAEQIAAVPSSTIRELPVACLLTLFEKRCSILVGDACGMRHVFFRDHDAGTTIGATLRNDERESWYRLVAA